MSKLDHDKLFMAYEEYLADVTAHFRKIMELQKENDALAAELERVKAQNEIMKVALHGLNNEVVAMLVTHGDVIAQDYGRTNLECVEYRLKIAREALAKVSQVNLNTHPESEEVW